MNTNNPFAQFEIEHLSASSINLFIQDICLFIVRYLVKHKSPTNPAMLRGTIIDHAIGKNYTIQQAQEEFKKLMAYEKKQGNVFDKAKTLRDRFSFTREDGEVAYVRFFDNENWNNKGRKKGSF